MRAVPLQGGGVAENFIAAVLCGEPGVGAVLPVGREIRRGVFLAEKKRGGVGARRAEGAGAKLGNRHDVEIFEDDFPAFDIDVAAV